jgi:hypothetical protein
MMQPLGWPCPQPGGASVEEYALAFDRGRASRLLIVPALFDEANRMRRFTVEVMRRLDGAGIDSFLPDLPGTGESLAALDAQSLQGWCNAVAVALQHFGATHVLGLRGGCLLVPETHRAWLYAPARGGAILRQMLRARTLSAREAGREESRERLTTMALAEGIELAGYRLGPQLFADLEEAAAPENERISLIEQGTLGGPGLWLRAEPGESREQADALAAILSIGMRA